MRLLKIKMKDLIISTPCLEDARKKSANQGIIFRDAFQIDNNLSNYLKSKYFYIRTFGCQANVRDSEIMAGMLTMAGMIQTDDYQKAAICIINTCAVRENAVDKMYGEIGTLKSMAKKSDVLAVCGCVCEQPSAVEKIRSTYPHINLIFGTHEVPLLMNYLKQIILDKYKRVISIKSQGGDIFENLPSKRTNPYKAFVNIMYGCNKFCTYCIVPYTRGRERSRLAKDILDECQELIDSGYQEITLLGQNVNAYGKDLKKGGLTFAQLLEEVAKLGIPRLRFTTSHPWDFSKDIIEVIAKYPNIMKSIHLPVQSGNDEILKSMGRRYNSTQYKKLVDEMKKMIPNLTLSTDIIVGFPNETYEQFLDTLKMVDYVQYDSAFTFIYSPRQGTPAAKKNDDVSLQEKHRRFNELVKTCEKYISASSSKMVGHVYEVLVDGPSKNNPNILSGYTESNKIVHFAGDQSLIGKIVKIKIIESHTYSLIGELYNE